MFIGQIATYEIDNNAHCTNNQIEQSLNKHIK